MTLPKVATSPSPLGTPPSQLAELDHAPAASTFHVPSAANVGAAAQHAPAMTNHSAHLLRRRYEPPLGCITPPLDSRTLLPVTATDALRQDVKVYSIRHGRVRLLFFKYTPFPRA